MKTKTRLMGLGAFVLLLAVLVFAFTSPVFATEILDESEVTIAAGEVIDDDVLVMGRRVVVDGVIKGDLLASVGEELIINGQVEGSVAAAGPTITVNGVVDGSMYVGGMALTLAEGSEVGRNVYLGGASLTAEPGSSVGRSVYAGAYQVILNGDVANDVTVGSAALEVTGTIGGDLMGEVEVTEGGGAFPSFFFTPAELEFVEPGMRVSEGTVAGEMGVTETVIAPEIEQQPTFAPFAVSGFWWTLSQRVGEFIALLIVGALIIRFWPTMLNSSTKMIESRPWPSLGWGFVLTVVFPFVILAGLFLFVVAAFAGGFITFGYLGRAFTFLGGATLSMIVALFGLAFFMLSKIVVTYWFGKLLLGRNRPEASRLLTHFGYLVLGAFIYEIVRAIPYAGALVAMVVILFGMGAMFLAWRAHRAELAPAEAKPAMATAD